LSSGHTVVTEQLPTIPECCHGHASEASEAHAMLGATTAKPSGLLETWGRSVALCGPHLEGFTRSMYRNTLLYHRLCYHRAGQAHPAFNKQTCWLPFWSRPFT